MSFPFRYSPHELGCVFYIKHMVCARGIRVVRRELEKLDLTVCSVRLGAATVAHPAAELDWGRLREALDTAGFALLEDPQHALVAQVKHLVEELLHRSDTVRHRDFVPLLALEVGLSVRRLQALFGRLPEQENLLAYITRQRLGYAQELLATSQLGIGQIARRLGYSSLAHFSGQFRRFAHCAPSIYRQLLSAAAEEAPLHPAAPNDAS